MTPIQTMAAKLQHEVINQDYYSLLYCTTAAKHGMMPVCILLGDYSDRQIVAMCNDFWLQLPDVSSIRRGPFWLLCDIAEHCFD